MMPKTRPAAVAGRFYPEDPSELAAVVDAHLERGASAGRAPKAVIAPHAGYVYSGAVAGHAFAALQRASESVDRVVLIGPSHHVGFSGLAISGADSFETPLGKVDVDAGARDELVDAGLLRQLDEPHAMEHSLETHLPFLQRVLGDFEIVPIVTGDVPAEQVARVLDTLWGADETIVSVSSDLSHFLTYDEARDVDAQTCRAIEAIRPDEIARDQACGRRAIQGLLVSAARRGMSVETLDLRNSGDTAGPKDSVVGYGAWAVAS